MGFADRYVEHYVAVHGPGEATGVEVVDVGRKWIGNSTYVWGGGRNQADIQAGRFDCSAFVHWAFAQVGVELGRVGMTTTFTLKNMGRAVTPENMKPGDLVFFDTNGVDGHVGIYAGNGRFIGSQSSTGVAFADMSTGYWKKYFNGRVRRILP
nr:C40 family peptidase [Thalassobacillus pellis]